MKIIGFTGRKRHGKDSLAAFMYGFLNKEGKKVAFEPFAGPLYRAVSVISGIDYLTLRQMDKSTIVQPFNRSLRYVLQTMGTEWGRNTCDPLMWSRAWSMRLLSLSCDVVLVPDVRFDDEAKTLINAGGFIIRVDRPGYSESDGGVADHESEKQISPELVNTTVVNNKSLEDLKEHCYFLAMSVIA